MMGWDDIFNAIALGTTLARSVVRFRKHISALRAGPPVEYAQPSALEALDRRVAELESLAGRQAERISALQLGLDDASAVTSELVRRVGAIFWMVSLSATAALVALVIAIVAIARTH